jgi:putative transposase
MLPLCTGCRWRYFPIDFPPKSSVWPRFDQWRRDGTLDRIHHRLRRKVRTTAKPYHPRTSASVDSQSIDTTSGGEQRGRDNAKNAAAGHHRQSTISGQSSPPPSAIRISER